MGLAVLGHVEADAGAFVAEELFRMRNNHYDTFVQLLVDLDARRPFNATNIEVLIKMDYFREFGHNGKLLEIWWQFRNGEGLAYKKTYVEATQQKRLAKLIEFERICPDETLSPIDQLSFEAVHYGSPISVFPECKQMYVCMNTETKYSPKLTLYSAVTGRTGVVKIKKDYFRSNPVDVGDIIVCGAYDNRPRYQYTDNKPVPIPGTKELWVHDYVIISRASGENDGSNSAAHVL